MNHIQKMNDSIDKLGKVCSAVDNGSENYGKMIKVVAQTQIRICDALSHVLFYYKPKKDAVESGMDMFNDILNRRRQ
jgi:hypothetical protein